MTTPWQYEPNIAEMEKACDRTRKELLTSSLWLTLTPLVCVVLAIAVYLLFKGCFVLGDLFIRTKPYSIARVLTLPFKFIREIGYALSDDPLCVLAIVSGFLGTIGGLLYSAAMWEQVKEAWSSLKTQRKSISTWRVKGQH